jgi:23S rRNA (uracil1939-C5)-methyltransferase
MRVVEPSRQRVAPACAHALRCGGCDWMHLDDAAQREAHREIVTQAIAHATGVSELPEVRVREAPRTLGYRARARLIARAAPGGRVAIGYRAAASHALAEVDACAVLEPSLAGLLGELPEVLAGATGEGDVSIARGTGGKPVVDIAWRGELSGAFWAALDARTQGSHPPWAGGRVFLEGARAPQVFGDPRPCGEGPDGGLLRFAAGGFAQTSDAGAALLARRVAELAGGGVGPDASHTPAHVVELFAGSGTLSVLLARGAASFTAVEVDADAAACARENLATRGLDGKVVATDADRFEIPARATTVVLDPPRTGAAGAVRAIAAARARVVVYVACDPATLARDLAILTRANFAITDLETVELFPQTSHVETIVRLERRRPA